MLQLPEGGSQLTRSSEARTSCAHGCVLVSTVDPVHAPNDPTRTLRQVTRCFYRGLRLSNHCVCSCCAQGRFVQLQSSARHLALVLCRLTFTPRIHSSCTRLQFAAGEIKLSGESVNSQTLGLSRQANNRQTFGHWTAASHMFELGT